MALGAFIERHFDAADHELAPFDEPVEIVAYAAALHF